MDRFIRKSTLLQSSRNFLKIINLPAFRVGTCRRALGARIILINSSCSTNLNDWWVAVTHVHSLASKAACVSAVGIAGCVVGLPLTSDRVWLVRCAGKPWVLKWHLSAPVAVILVYLLAHFRQTLQTIPSDDVSPLNYCHTSDGLAHLRQRGALLIEAIQLDICSDRASSCQWEIKLTFSIFQEKACIIFQILDYHARVFFKNLNLTVQFMTEFFSNFKIWTRKVQV